LADLGPLLSVAEPMICPVLVRQRGPEALASY